MSSSALRNERRYWDFPYLVGAIRMVALGPMTMMREPLMIMVIVLSALLATPAQTRNVSRDNYSIMVPERGSDRNKTYPSRKYPNKKYPIRKYPNGTSQNHGLRQNINLQAAQNSR
jgi:hypothetical protein